MYRTLQWCLLPLGAVLLMAADASWKDKALSQWNEEDARQILTDSPWVRYVTPENLPDKSPDQRRDGGDWDEGIGHGVGIAGTGILGPRRAAEAIKEAHQKPLPAGVAIRWESAIPVRAAEKKIGEADAPVLTGDDYAIAVYGIAAPRSRLHLATELKGIAYLRRLNKKDLKPSRVQIVPQDDGTDNIVYFFPRSVEIGKKDGGIEFVAQIGHLFVSQYFFTGEMQINGELQVLMPTEARGH
jgi:hypothetical protein